MSSLPDATKTSWLDAIAVYFKPRVLIVLLLGFTQLGAKDAINIGYSFDYTISKLGTGSGGAHEFSLVYTWPMRNPRKPPRDKLIIPCPDF